MSAPTKEMTGTQMRSAIAAFVKAWNDHDVEAIVAKTTTDVVWASANAPGPARVAHGREAAAADVRAGLAALRICRWRWRTSTSSRPTTPAWASRPGQPLAR